MICDRASVIVLLVGLLSAFFVNAHPGDDETMLQGPNGLKAFVGRKGGGIRLYRETESGPGGRGPRKTGEIEIIIGRIRETNGTDTEEMDSEDEDRESSLPPEPRTTAEPRGGHPPGGPQPRHPPRGRGPRPRVDRPGDINFNVENRRNQNLQRGAGPVIRGHCLILTSPPIQEVSNSVLTLTVCTVNDNGTLTIGDEETEISDGQLKFTIQLDNWPWSSDGQFLDVDVVMKVPAGRMVRGGRQMGGGSGMGPKRPVMFSLGHNATASFPTKAELDNSSLVDMPDGFPSAPRHRRGDYVITLRFPRFNTTVFYDPTVDATNEEATDVEMTTVTSDETTTSGGVAACACCTILPLTVGLLLAVTASKFVL